jgi:hypothetical protein
MDSSVVKTFERLFYNIRDDEGRLKGNTGLVMYAALKGSQRLEPAGNANNTNTAYWRVLAFEGGYRSVFAEWGWPYKNDFPGYTVPEFTVDLMRDTYRYLGRNLKFQGHVDMRAVSQILTTLTGQLADMRKEGILSDKDKVDPNSLVIALLGLLAPSRMIDTDDPNSTVARDLETRVTAIRSKEGRSEIERPVAFRNIEAQLNKGAQ